MKKYSTFLHNFGLNISNSFIIGFSLITYGIITRSYLHGVNNLQLLHIKHKYRKEVKQIDNLINLNDLINIEDKLISYYWNNFIISSIIGITGVSLIIFRSHYY
jgi:hypothetical protein